MGFPPAPTIPQFRLLAARGKRPRVAALGDSITGPYNFSFTAGAKLAQENTGYMTWLAVLSRQRIEYDPFAGPQNGMPTVGDNHGIGGDTTAGALARLGNLLARKPEIVICMLGTNDIFSGVAKETIWANIREIARQVNDTGALYVALPITPRNASSWNTMGDSTVVLARQRAVAWINKQMQDYARVNPAFLFADIRPVLTASNGYGRTTSFSATYALQNDGLHPAPAFGFWAAQVILGVIEPYLPATVPSFTDLFDTYDATANPTGNFINDGGLMRFASGSAPIAPITGAVPSGYSVATQALTEGSVAAAMEPAAWGNKLVVTTTAARNATKGSVVANVPLPAVSTFTPGMTLRAECDVELSASTNLGTISLAVVENNGDSAVTYADMDDNSPYTMPLEAWSGRLGVRPFILRPAGAGARSLVMQVLWSFDTPTFGPTTHTVKLSLPSLRRI